MDKMLFVLGALQQAFFFVRRMGVLKLGIAGQLSHGSAAARQTGLVSLYVFCKRRGCMIGRGGEFPRTGAAHTCRNVRWAPVFARRLRGYIFLLTLPFDQTLGFEGEGPVGRPQKLRRDARPDLRLDQGRLVGATVRARQHVLLQ